MNPDPDPDEGPDDIDAARRVRTRALVAVAGVVVLLAGIWLIVVQPGSSRPSEPPIASGPTSSGTAPTSAGSGEPGAPVVPPGTGPAPGSGGSPGVAGENSPAPGAAPGAERDPGGVAPGSAPPAGGPVPGNGTAPDNGTAPGDGSVPGVDSAPGNNPAPPRDDLAPPGSNPPPGNDPPPGNNPPPGNSPQAGIGSVPRIDDPAPPAVSDGFGAPSPSGGGPASAPAATPSVEPGVAPPQPEAGQLPISVPLSTTAPANPVVFVASPNLRLYSRRPPSETDEPAEEVVTEPLYCRAIANGSPFGGGDMEIEFRGAEIVSLQPSEESGFEIFRADPETEQCAELADVSPATRPCTPSTVLATSGAEATCVLGVDARKSVSKDRSANLVLGFRAVCISRAEPPCSRSEVARASPSVDRPVEVTWQQVVPLFACLTPPFERPTVEPGVPDELLEKCQTTG